MNIEEELKTSKFQSETHKAHLNVLFSASWLKNRVNTTLKPFDLTSEQFNVIRIVRGKHPEGVRVKDIRSRMLERSSNTTRIIDRLVDKGLLVREKTIQDGRERAILLTADGQSLLLEIDAHWIINNPHESVLTPEEADTLSHLLDKMRN